MVGAILVFLGVFLSRHKPQLTAGWITRRELGQLLIVAGSALLVLSFWNGGRHF